MVTSAQVLAGAAAMLATVQSGAAFVAAPSGRLGLPQLVAHAPVRSPPRAAARTARRLGPVMQEAGFFSKLARTIQEKAKADIERTQRLFNGLEGVTGNMNVIDELISFWNLEDADVTLEKLEVHARVFCSTLPCLRLHHVPSAQRMNTRTSTVRIYRMP